MKYLRYTLSAMWVLVACLLAGLAPAAETTTPTSGAGSFRVEQIYVNVPEMDVFFYAQDAKGNSYSPMVVQAAGLELTVGDQKLDTSSLGQADGPICYLVAVDNSSDIDPVDFRQMRGALWQLIRSKKEDDQIALYTLAGQVTCVQPATSDANALYTALASITQADGQI